MLRLSRRCRRDERGVGIVLALMTTFVVAAVAATWANLAVHQVEGSGRERSREQAVAAAEAGINAIMSRLSATPLDCSPVSGTIPGVGDYDVSFDPAFACTGTQLQRYIKAVGYSPSRTADRKAARQLEQQVELVPLDGFRFALFAAPAGVTAANNLTVMGDLYSSLDVNLTDNSKVFGGVTSLGSVTVSNRSTIGGRIHAVGSIAVNGSDATIEGDTWSSTGSITNRGWVKGNAMAAGAITLTGSGRIDGQQAAFSPPPTPHAQSLPTFTWNPASYTPFPTTWNTASGFYNHWSNNRTAFSGHHRVTGASISRITLDQRWTLAGDATLVSDGPVTLSREIANASSSAVTFAVVSLATGDDAITMTNQLTLPQDIKVLFFAPNGCVRFSQLKHFSGAVYAKCIYLDNQFSLTYAPVSVPGFTWDASSSNHFTIQSRSFREVPVGS